MNCVENFKNNLIHLADKYYTNLICEFGEIILECSTTQYRNLLFQLRDNEIFAFTQLIDLCAIDYLHYKNKKWEKERFVIVCNLLSITNNLRVRVKVAIDDDTMPMIESVVDIFNNANWYEREAFDLYGILFKKHPDLRRILTDYNFVGHPLRKDFPVSGYMEMIYDESQERVIYQNVSIEPRINVPRIVREDDYGN